MWNLAGKENCSEFSWVRSQDAVMFDDTSSNQNVAPRGSEANNGGMNFWSVLPWLVYRLKVPPQVHVRLGIRGGATDGGRGPALSRGLLCSFMSCPVGHISIYGREDRLHITDSTLDNRPTFWTTKGPLRLVIRGPAANHCSLLSTNLHSLPIQTEVPLQGVRGSDGQ